MNSCGCPGRVVDLDLHAAWHAIVREQTGIERGPVDFYALKSARGYSTPTIAGDTILDVRARESGRRASGEQRRRAHG